MSELTYEIPSSLKQLARFVARGFYTLKDSLIIDMLVRNPCMKGKFVIKFEMPKSQLNYFVEDDIAELLKFEKKMLRAHLGLLKNDKFIQARLKMETAPDGKAHKINYYFINYKVFVNVIKYKLDMMRKRLETEERDATSRANFKCTNCCKTFTDLEVDQLIDLQSGELRCTYCGSLVEEDMSAIPKKDSRLMLAKFNEQLQPLYDLLREVEGIKLAPEVLEPQPVDIDVIRGLIKPGENQGGIWSGEATRNSSGFADETRVDITIGEDSTDNTVVKKEQPIWLTESTVVSTTENSEFDAEINLEKVAQSTSAWNSTPSTSSRNKKETAEENIMSVLLANEKQTTKATNDAVKNLNGNNGDSSGGDSSAGEDDDENFDTTEIRKSKIIVLITQ